jgi:hypothetical protein
MTNNKQQTEINAVEYISKVNQFAKENNTGKPKQQTAIEWLEEEMLKPNLSMKEILEQAKEMEKERTINFTEDWYFNGPLLGEGIDVKNTIEQHFNNTYGGGEQ